MMTSSLLAAILVPLLSGQSASDRQAYAIYQAKLAAMTAPASTGATPSETAGADPTASAAATGPVGCILVRGAGNTATTSDCTSCHVTYQAQHSHPVDVYQGAGRSRSLRTAAEVVQRGVFLAEGRVTCLSCHDGNSTWKYKLALPPGAQVRPRVKSGDPLTYESGALVRTAVNLPAGSDVSPTPLCKACHAFD